MQSLTSIFSLSRGFTYGGMPCRSNPYSVCVRTQLPYRALVQGEAVADVMRDAVNECLAVARAAGIQVPGDPWAAVQRTGRMVGQYSSMAQDLARGRPSEIDHLNGYVVRRGEALGVATPVNRILQTLVKLLDTKALAVGSMTTAL